MALAIVAVAGLLRFWALDAGLPHPLTRPDEEVVLAQTEAPARGRVALDWAIYPSGYVDLTWTWGEVALRVGEWIGAFPPGGYLSVMHEHPDRLILVNRVLSAAAGTATVGAVIAAARAGLGPGAALAAGALLATSFLHVRDSHAAKPDVLLGLGFVLALWAMAPLARRATLGRAAAVAAAIGLTMGVKYPAVLLLPPAYVAAVKGGGARGWRALFAGPPLVLAPVAAAVFLATSPSLVIDPRSWSSLRLLVSTLLPHGVPGALAPASQPWWSALVYHAAFSLCYGAGLVPALLAPIAVAWGLSTRRPLFVLLALFAVLYFVVAGLTPIALARYMTPLLPVLALLEGGMLAAVARAPVLLAVATLALLVQPLADSMAFDRIASQTDTRVLATNWMASHVPRGARVAVVGTQQWVYGVPQMPPGVEARNLTPDRATLAAAGVTHVLAHDHPLPFSHVDPNAMEALAPHLRLLAEFDPFRDGPDGAIFEAKDAYYIPIHGFAAVTRPGPLVRIFAWR